MPRTPIQGVAFLLGFVIALWLSPFVIGVAHGDAEPFLLVGRLAGAQVAHGSRALDRDAAL